MNTMRIKTFSIVSNAIEEGLALGWQRAHKHIEEPDYCAVLSVPEAAIVQDYQHSAIMELLCDIIDWGDKPYDYQS